MQVFNRKPGVPNAATRKTVEFFLEAYKKVLYPGPLQLPDIFSKYDLEEIAMEVYPTDHFPDIEKVRSGGKLFLAGACTAMMPFILKDRTDGLTEEGVKTTVEESMKELDGDIFVRSEMQFMVSRKKSA